MTDLEKRQQKIYKGGRTYTRTVTNIEDWALGLRGAVVIEGTKYRAFHYHGDIWTCSAAHYREQR